MAFQNEPPRADPNTKVQELLAIVDGFENLFKMQYAEPRIPRSNSKVNEISLIRRRPQFEHTEDGMFLRLRHHLELVHDRLINLQELQEEVNKELLRHCPLLEEQLMLMESYQLSSHGYSSRISNAMKRDVADITRKISDLVSKLPPLLHTLAKQKSLDKGHDGKGIIHLSGLHGNEEDLTKLQAFREVKHAFMELGTEQRMCLLSFAVFPENREVHRTMLKYWWIGEEILPVEGAEEAVRDVLKDFTDKNLVEPVENRHKVAPSSYKMTPFVHSSVVLLSKQIGLFDIYRKGDRPTMCNSKMGKVCLVEWSSYQPELSVDQIETVFNVSERYPEFTFKWFSEHSSYRKTTRLSKTVFKSLRVFYLGRWERTQKRHIYVPNPELMKYLKVMKNLRLLSFQGISTITRLKSSVCKLHKLVVLDLRECSDLTELPEKIDSLRSLVYLDMTGCYMLEWIPRRLNLLNNLEVLKGFVVSDTVYVGVACTLSFLKRLKKLRKLSIEIHRDGLGVHQLMEDLVKLKELTSLKVTWRRDLNIICVGKADESTEIEISLPDKLKKLDLQRFPHEQLPTWLHPYNLLHLNKLHIGGARRLKGFGDLPEKATECAVEVLRLTFLPKLRVGWIELKKLYFPNLSFLVNYECPRVSLTPCDGNGIWRSDQDG